MTNYHDHRDDYLSLQANVICLLLFGFRRKQAGRFSRQRAQSWERLSTSRRKLSRSRTRRRNKPLWCHLNSQRHSVFMRTVISLRAQFSMLILLTCTQSCWPDSANPPVPFRPCFDPETIREMSLALESVCDTLGLKVIDDAA